MSTTFNFSLPSAQDGTVQISISPPVSISGWSLRWDLMYNHNSPNPIISKYLASGYSNFQSGIGLTNGAIGVFSVQLFASEISGVGQGTSVLAHQTWRTDSGFRTPVVGGFRDMPSF